MVQGDRLDIILVLRKLVLKMELCAVVGFGIRGAEP
jgi:hypothetical protein